MKQFYEIGIVGLDAGSIKYGGEFTNGKGFMQSLSEMIKRKSLETDNMAGLIANEKKQIENLRHTSESEFEHEGELTKLEAEHTELAQKLTANQVKGDGPRPVLHDYIDSTVEIKDAIIEDGEVNNTELSPNTEAGEDDSGIITEEQKKEILEAYNYAMNGRPAAKLTGKEFQKDNVPLTKKVTQHYKEKYNGIVVHPELGEVCLDLEGVKDSLGHGIGRIKAAAYAVVPQLIKNGKIFDRQKIGKAVDMILWL